MSRSPSRSPPPLSIRRARTRLALAGAVGWLLLVGASVALHKRDPGPARTLSYGREANVHSLAYSAGNLLR